jgi:hypothetical protein
MSQGNTKDSSRLKGDARLRREQRQLEAVERNEQTAKLSIEQRLARLDVRPGSSQRERGKLEDALVQQQARKLKAKTDKQRSR